MKKIEAIVRKDKLSTATEALKLAGVKGFSISDIKGRGSGERPTVRGGRGTTSYTAEYNTLNSVVTLVEDSEVDNVLNTIVNAVHTGSSGDGIIYVTNVEEVLNISSKKKGSEAL